jgi:endogenous inhibitor of DNA gyrase (YacG/DUF329 family)
MHGRLPEPAFMPCPECGASVPRAERDEHVCERERWLDYQLFVRQAEVARFDADLAAYFDSPEGRLRVREAERGREPEGRDQTDDEKTD